MQAVILAAGKGSRMGALTESTPKALLELFKQPLLQYELDTLPDYVDEVVIIVGYLGHLIQQRFGGEYKGKRLLYVEQDVLDGTAGALWRARDILKDRFIVMMADDLYGKEDIERCVAKAGWVELIQERDAIHAKGKVELDKHGNIARIIEGNHGETRGLLGTNLFVLDTRVFDCPLIAKTEGSKEFGLPQTVIAGAKQLGIPFQPMIGTSWLEITSPEDLKKAEQILEWGEEKK